MMQEETAGPSRTDRIEVLRPSAAPLILAVGITLMGAGVALGLSMSLVGLVVFVAGLAAWIGNLLPGRGHDFEAPGPRPQPIAPAPGTVQQMQAGMPGYRMRLPLHVHPISAGIKGGIVGGLVMPIPALIWSLVNGHGVWYPINLLAGMVLSNVADMPPAELKEFQLPLFLVGLAIHIVMCLVIGLIYGVLLPTLPAIPKAFAWGALLMPLLWTGLTFGLMGVVNPVLQGGVRWPWFIASQFVFGIVLAAIVTSAARLGRLAAGILGGILSGLLMAVPAVLWSLGSGHGLWYPINLLAGMVVPGMDELPQEQLDAYNAHWLTMGLVIHAVISLAFGVAFSLALPSLPAIPGPIASGGLLLPLVWTGMSYGLMGVVNPLLQKEVNWPWFIVSQFVFGITAAIVVSRTETIAVPPAGTGPDTEARPH
jgi:hypothetical protein